MSVPLDRLYNFLHDVCNRDDILIYRFFPHGSKKLEDLKPHMPNGHLSWVQKMTHYLMICHDQEILQYDLYSVQDLHNNLEKKDASRHAGEVRDLLVRMHLRSQVTAPFNGNDQVLLCHSEKHSQELTKYESNNFVGVYYWSHALIARDWFRYAEIDPALTVDFGCINKDFLIYNRAWSGTREYRLTFAEMVLNRSLQDFCNMSFSVTDGYAYTDHVFVNPQLAIARQDLENFYPCNIATSAHSADYTNTDYKESAIEVVLETLFDDTRWHLTEKTLRPIACGRPFILAATPGSLQYLREYGFETFHGLINESYDSITDPKQRLEAITQEMQRISSLDTLTKQKLWEELYKIAARNKQRFFSAEWHRDIVNEFKCNLEQACARVQSTGKFWTQLENATANDQEIQQIMKADIPGVRTLEELQQFRDWLNSN